MAAPKTLVELATQKRDTARQAVIDAQTRLSNAQKSQGAKRNELAAVRIATAALDKEITGIRAQLAAVPTPADGPALLDALGRLIIRSRTRQAEILEMNGALAEADASASRGQSDLATASTRVAAAERELKEAVASEKLRNDWQAALTAAPLVTLHTDAKNTILAAPFTTADARFSVLPPKLLKLAKDRRIERAKWCVLQTSNLAEAEDAAAGEEKNSGGLEGKARHKLLALTRAEAAARTFVQTAQSRFDEARALLTKVAEAPAPPLTAEQVARIDEPTLKGVREGAADQEAARDAKWKIVREKWELLSAEKLKPTPSPAAQANYDTAVGEFDKLETPWRKEEKARDAALQDVASKESALALAIQSALAAKKDPDTTPEVATAKGVVAAARASLKTAEEDYAKSPHGALHAWEAVVPDSAWRMLDDFFRAAQILDELGSNAAADVAKALSDAEKDYVDALAKADTSEAFLDRLAAEQSQRSALRKEGEKSAVADLISALRGDN